MVRNRKLVGKKRREELWCKEKNTVRIVKNKKRKRKDNLINQRN